MLQISKNSVLEWEDRGVTSLSIEFVQKGCEGTTVVVHENTSSDTAVLVPCSSTSIPISVDPQHVSLLEDAMLTYASGKWILKSDDVLTRCGCGKSFSLKSGNMREDKIRLLKSKLAKKQHH